jgi:RimJ/RimL family protein N-acetyltransferase
MQNGGVLGVLERSAAYNLSELTFEETGAPTPETVVLLEQTLWGTDEALYTMHHVPATLRHLLHPRYLLLKKNGRLIGVRVMVEKSIWFLERWQPAVYHSFFAIAPSEKGRGYGKFLAAEVLRRYQPSSQGNRPVYAFIEAGNHRSRHISESLGYRRIRDFHALFFSRSTPRWSARACCALPSEILRWRSAFKIAMPAIRCWKPSHICARASTT